MKVVPAQKPLVCLKVDLLRLYIKCTPSDTQMHP